KGRTKLATENTTPPRPTAKSGFQPCSLMGTDRIPAGATFYPTQKDPTDGAWDPSVGRTCSNRCFDIPGVTLNVQRTDDTSTEVGVDYATADGTATNGLKYTAVSGTLAFGAGETNKAIVVPILNEGFLEGTKSFRVILSNPTGGALLGARTNVPVSISDNDVGIQFQFAAYSVAENAGAVLIGVVRGDDGTIPLTVDFATSNLTATSGLDYSGATNTLTFAPQERFKLIPIAILNDGLKEVNKTFRVTLSNPVGATLGSQKTATVTIVDNDQGFQFDLANYNVDEDGG